MVYKTQIGANGFFTFGVAGNHCCPSLFPGDPPWQYTVAPFATDVSIISGDGVVSYEVHTLSSDSELLSEVNKLLRQRGRIQFAGTWMLVANWKNVPENVRFSCNYLHTCCEWGLFQSTVFLRIEASSE